MKLSKKFAIIAALFATLLTGCSLLEQVNTTLNYATEATAFVNDANRFAEQVPLLAEQALTNPETIERLRQELEAMKAEIAAFDALQAPAFAEDVHARFVAYNETVREQIDGYLRQIDENVIDLDALAQAPMLETIRNMTELLQQLERLQQ
ncbi:DUF6376 family protein [Paenibacillus sp.]|uniref:DUF6376 family protein n=1 Tax=Paenibacillus sp. TaxID=58172 RepID=UPI002D59F394|nr:DUF6376 family protein [Paenibacillus sp.]HZG55001.1 DUF6376 family protein [Paenibacillus sp.]